MKWMYASFVALIAMSCTVAQANYSTQPGDVTIVITHGQSLSVGVSSSTSPAVSKTAEYPANALTLNSGSTARNSFGWLQTPVNPALITGFTPFIQASNNNESPGSGVLGAIIDSFDQNHLARPILLHISGGRGGRSLTELMLRTSDIYSSTAAGLAATPNGSPFCVLSGSTYQYYVNINGVAVGAVVNNTGAGPASSTKPVYYNNILEQVKRAVQIAQKNNQRINPDVYFVWIQGQNDSSNPNYKVLLKELLRRMEADLRVATGLGSQMKFNSFMSQLRGIHDKNRAIDQIEVANEVPNSHFGAQESWISNGFALGGSGGTHLHKVGYRLMGEQIGHSIFQVMMNGQEAVPAITSVSVNGKVLTVTFGGLRGALVADNSIHQSAGIPVPPNFGFYLYSNLGKTITNNSIASSRILNASQVELTLTNTLTGPLYLYLGRNQTRLVASNSASLHAGTTLRDSVEDKFAGFGLTPATSTFLGQTIPRFAPIQRVLISNTSSNFQGYMGLVTP